MHANKCSDIQYAWLLLMCWSTNCYTFLCSLIWKMQANLTNNCYAIFGTKVWKKRTQINYKHLVHCRFTKRRNLPTQKTQNLLQNILNCCVVNISFYWKKNCIHLKGFLFVGYPGTLVSIFYCFFFLFNLSSLQWKNLLDSRRRQAVWYRRLKILFLKPQKMNPFLGTHFNAFLIMKNIYIF